MIQQTHNLTTRQTSIPWYLCNWAKPLHLSLPSQPARAPATSGSAATARTRSGTGSRANPSTTGSGTPTNPRAMASASGCSTAGSTLWRTSPARTRGGPSARSNWASKRGREWRREGRNGGSEVVRGSRSGFETKGKGLVSRRRKWSSFDLRIHEALMLTSVGKKAVWSCRQNIQWKHVDLLIHDAFCFINKWFKKSKVFYWFYNDKC